jgi:glycosyltransferase involved in cell wall biosynthesis
MRIRYYCPWGQQNGYSRAAADYIAALHAANVPVEIVPMFAHDPANVEEGYHHLNELVGKGSRGDPTHIVVHAMPCEAARRGRALREAWDNEAFEAQLGGGPFPPKLVALTTWENDIISGDVAIDLGEVYDHVLVPSMHCRNALHRVSAPVTVVPHFFDPIFWSPSAYDAAIEEEDEYGPSDAPDPFAFYTIGVNSPRKNLDGLLQTYLSRFLGDDVVLRIVCGSGVEDLERRVEEIKTACGFPDDHAFPAVEFISDRMPAETLRDVHMFSDCYISMSRGEGWGLGAFEAVLMGNPVIVSCYGGWRDYLPPLVTEGIYRPGGFAYIEGRLTPALVFPEITMRSIGIGGLTVPVAGQRRSAAEGVNAGQNWFDPSLLSASNHMFEMIASRWWRAGARAYGLEPTAMESKKQASRVTHGRAVPLYGYNAIAKRFVAALEAC